MNPVTHLLVGWSVAVLPFRLTPRERGAIALASVAPDVDGVGLVMDLATAGSAHPTAWWGAFHHVVGHGLAAACVVTGACALAARPQTRRTVAALGLLSFHLHVLGDLVGARGPDGDQWPIFYLWPLSASPALTLPFQWELNAWPNMALTAALLGFAFERAWRVDLSLLMLVSVRAHAAVVHALRTRFGQPP